MSGQRDIDLIEELLSHGTELTWLEFKKNNFDPKITGMLCSAISNGARLAGRDCGYVLWGVDDATHQIIVTIFRPHSEKISNQDFQFWLAAELKPNLAINFKIIQHSKGRIVPGKPLMQPDRMIDLPPRSRNEMMASLMRRMGFCEEILI